MLAAPMFTAGLVASLLLGERDELSARGNVGPRAAATLHDEEVLDDQAPLGYCQGIPWPNPRGAVGGTHAVAVMASGLIADITDRPTVFGVRP